MIKQKTKESSVAAEPRLTFDVSSQRFLVRFGSLAGR
jgi:hypothetical protein